MEPYGSREVVKQESCYPLSSSRSLLLSGYASSPTPRVLVVLLRQSFHLFFSVVTYIQVCLSSVWCRVLHGSALGSEPPTSMELDAYAGYDTI